MVSLFHSHGSLDEYKALIAYCDSHKDYRGFDVRLRRVLVSHSQGELEACREMMALLPGKIQKLTSQYL